MRRPTTLLVACAASVLFGASPSLAQSGVTAMPDGSDAPRRLGAAVRRCRRGDAPSCVVLGDHYFSHVAGGRGRTFYRRAADLDWESSPPAVGSNPFAAGAPIRNEREAVARFRAAWPGIVASITNSAERALAEQLRASIAAATLGSGLSARTVSHRAAYRTTHQYWHEHDGSLRSVVLRGAPMDLRRPSSCWEVRFSGSDMEGELSAYLSREDGTVLVVLRHPEG